ncbi:MAG: GH3 auxin-responsive promoter family protein [Bacteroidales bacterium]|nr:GH3 auxin-responsive promoter family protein [Bacteroidales bacterium]
MLLGSLIKSAYALRNGPVEIKHKYVSIEKAQEKQLNRLLRKAKHTAFGEHYNFTEILNSENILESFRKNVPVHDYSSIYKRWWYRALNGETYVSWPGKVKYFALSSGTSEASSKYIPVTNDMLRSIKRTSIRQLVRMVQYDFPLDFYEKGMLMIGGSTHLQYNGTYYQGDLSGITAASIPFWFQHFYKPGKKISRTADWNTKIEEIVQQAPDWDIGVIVGVPAWVQVLLEKIIETYHLNTIHDLWPNLSVMVHSGVAIQPYLKSFEKLFSKKMIYNESYLASEGYVAFQNRKDSTGMDLIVDNGIFFELIPFNDQNFDEEGDLRKNPQTLCFFEAEENKEYALILSSNAGAWRYLIGDTIKIVDKKYAEIHITGRTKHFLSVCGEHLSQENMNRAVELLQNDLGIEIKEFTVYAFSYKDRFAHQWYLGTDQNLNPEEAANILDKHLKNLNDDYRVERLEAVSHVFAKTISPKVFLKYMEMKEKMGSANKFPRVLKNGRIPEWETFLKTQSL